MTRRASIAWVALFWAVGVPLFFGGPWLGALHTAGAAPLAQAPWIVGPAVVGFAVMALAIHQLMTAAQKANANIFETKRLRGYYIELAVAVTVYMAACIAQMLTPAPVDPVGRNLLAVAPVPGVILIILALARWVLRGDEYWRQSALRQIGVAAAVTAAWTWCYGFLEQIGAPRLSMFWVWPSMLLAWALWSGSSRLLRG